MSDFLGIMAASSRARVEELRVRERLARLQARAFESPKPPRLRRVERFELIAEVKHRSPASASLGNGDIAARVIAYAEAGAAAVSVLTEPTQFGGELAHLCRAAEALAPLGVPAMRKDFIVDPYQVLETRASGGGGVLLIVRMLSPPQLGELLDCARECGLFVLLEAFDESDLERAAPAVGRARAGANGAQVLVGVNCRDLGTLVVRRHRLIELAPRLPPAAPSVAESGIGTPADCVAVARAGFDFALVGSALMQRSEPGLAVRDMLAAGRSA